MERQGGPAQIDTDLRFDERGPYREVVVPTTKRQRLRYVDLARNYRGARSRLRASHVALRAAQARARALGLDGGDLPEPIRPDPWRVGNDGRIYEAGRVVSAAVLGAALRAAVEECAPLTERTAALQKRIAAEERAAEVRAAAHARANPPDDALIAEVVCEDGRRERWVVTGYEREAGREDGVLVRAYIAPWSPYERGGLQPGGVAEAGKSPAEGPCLWRGNKLWRCENVTAILLEGWGQPKGGVWPRAYVLRQV